MDHAKCLWLLTLFDDRHFGHTRHVFRVGSEAVPLLNNEQGLGRLNGSSEKRLNLRFAQLSGLVRKMLVDVSKRRNIALALPLSG